MSNEQLTPLNSILNLSEHTLKLVNEDKEVLNWELKFYMDIIRSSAKILEYGTQSQLSRLQIQSDVYEFKMEKTSRQKLKEKIENVWAPFMEMNKSRSVTLITTQTDSVPQSLNHD